MEFGEIRSCPHCGDMHGSMCEKGSTYTSSCASCLKAAGFDPVADKDRKVVCSVCNGKGKVWVGADYFQFHEHQESDLTVDAIEEFVERLESRLDILIKISDQKVDEEAK
jgi:NAD-dependent SIR2 family protein deacetylase